MLNKGSLLLSLESEFEEKRQLKKKLWQKHFSTYGSLKGKAPKFCIWGYGMEQVNWQYLRV